MGSSPRLAMCYTEASTEFNASTGSLVSSVDLVPLLLIHYVLFSLHCR